MPSHIHLLIFIDGSRLGAYMRDFKKFIAQKVAPDLGIDTSPVWEPRFDRAEIHSEGVLRQKLEYIHNNPMKAGLVARPEDWFWSSAVDYLGLDTGRISIFRGWF